MEESKTEDKPLVSIIIPTFNRKRELVRLLTSIMKSDYPKDKLEIIIVDDASNQDYTDIFEKFSTIVLIRNKKEKWVAETRNIGIRKSKGEYLFLIDDDNVIDESCITKLVNYLHSNSTVGIVGPIMYYYSNKNMIWCAGIKRNYSTSLTTFIGGGSIDKGQYNVPIKSEDFPNAFMIRRNVINDIGYFNSNTFSIHYEESDFCNRVRNAGYDIFCVTSAKVWHDTPIPSQSQCGFHFQNRKRAYYTARNRVLFHRLYNTKLQLVTFLSIFLTPITLYYVLQILKSDSKNKIVMTLEYIRGTLKGLVYKKNA